MNNTSQPERRQAPAVLINQEIHAEQSNFFHRCLDWWLRLTAVPTPPATASFIQREQAQKVRFLSLVILIFLLITLLFLPSAALSVVPNALLGCLGLMLIFLIALFINKQFQRPVLAGILVTLTVELVLAAMNLSVRPPNDVTVQNCIFLALGDIVAIMLVSPQFMFPVLFFNCAFCAFSLFYLPHPFPISTTIWIEPIIIQIIVAFVVRWHVNHLSKAVKRAERAEMVAALEHKIVEEQKARNREMQYLAASISSITRQYSHITGQHTAIAKISDQGFPGILRPLTNGFNMLQSRLQRVSQTEKEYLSLKQAFQDCTNKLYQGSFSPEHPPKTGTDLDLLLTALRDRYLFQPRLQHDQSILPPSLPPKSSETL